MEIYNTQFKKKQEFKPINGKIVKMYVCGPTTYDHSHLGHGRTYVAFDVIRRYLEHKNYIVDLIINFTDIDDKIINKANKENMSFKDLSNKYIKSFLEDMNKLNIKPPLIYPKVSEHIENIIKFIQKLEEKGYTYTTNNGVYFNTEKFSNYGELRNVNKLKDNNKNNNNNNKNKNNNNTLNIGNKKNSKDFALWKFAKPNEPKWSSPWGEGRPAWHIECSAISLEYLGEHFDIHGGGQDLTFPHHENEKAQSEAYININNKNNKKWVNYWIHTGFIMVNNEKMSKSLNNFSTLKDLFKNYSPELIRFFFLERHYSSPIDYTEESLNHSKNNLEKLKNTIQNINIALKNSEIKYKLNNVDKEIINKLNRTIEGFYKSMDNDFNTSESLKQVYELSTEINKYINYCNENNVLPNYSVLLRCYEFYKIVGEIFGIFDNLFNNVINNDNNKNNGEEQLINLLIEIRNNLKKNKNYELADEIRNKLNNLGIILEDNPKGTIWKRK